MPWVIGCRSGSQPEKCAKALLEDLTAFKLYTTLNFSKDSPKMAVFLKPEICFKDTILIALQKNTCIQHPQKLQTIHFDGPGHSTMARGSYLSSFGNFGTAVSWGAPGLESGGGVQVVNQTWIPVTSEMFGLFRLIGWWTYYLPVS